MTTGTHEPAVAFTEDGAIYRLGNGHVIEYRLKNGIYYHSDTPEAVINALELTRSCRRRVRLHYGDAGSGRDWLEEHDVEGYIENSIGPLRVPILVHNRRSHGGGALMDQAIVKIRWTTGGVLYQHTNYRHGEFCIREIGLEETFHGGKLRESGYSHAVDVDGKTQAIFKSMAAARHYLKKMIG
jgi:hypothetical protein